MPKNKVGKFLKKIMVILLVILGLLCLSVWLFMRQASFGTAPKGARLERIQRSPQYRNGAFHNQHPTPNFTNGATFFSVVREFFFRSHPRTSPDIVVPTRKNDLLQSPDSGIRFTWFGHSSYLIQSASLNILVDPVFSGRTSPVSYAGTRAFPGTDVYLITDMPRIDVLLITHDHYDHLDYQTILKLKDRVGVVVTSLGVGAHLEYWGLSADKITELDWWEKTQVAGQARLTAAPARHFSGRGFKRNQTLWSSFILELEGRKLYLGGDSGYDTHFKEIGQRFGPFDIAVLENGQYNASWANIHMMPEETVQAALDLQAKMLLPVHWGKFALATHPWDEPISRLWSCAEQQGVHVVTPIIGETIKIDSTAPAREWWLPPVISEN
jgi:L-ascorbate metabolism protein UlaG (beta-lactamase superfamily)